MTLKAQLSQLIGLTLRRFADITEDRGSHLLAEPETLRRDGSSFIVITANGIWIIVWGSIKAEIKVKEAKRQKNTLDFYLLLHIGFSWWAS